MSFAPSALLLLALLAQEPAAKKPSVFPAPGQAPAQQDPAKKPPIVTPPSVVTVDRAQVEVEYFTTMDYNEDSWISFREAEEALNMTRTGFQQYDTDADGRITKEEFGARYNELLDRTGGFPKPKPQGPAPTLGKDPNPADLINSVLGNLPVPEPAVTPESFVNQYDANVDGRLSGLELTQAGKSLGFVGLSGPAILTLIDTDQSGFAEPAELAAVLKQLGLMTAAGTAPEPPKAKSIEELFGHTEPRVIMPGSTPRPPVITGPVRPFRRLDINDDGVIQIKDLTDLSVSAHPRVSPHAVVATLDLDGDGALSPDEFAAAFDG